jgi:hypothetical protein
VAAAAKAAKDHLILVLSLWREAAAKAKVAKATAETSRAAAAAEDLNLSKALAINQSNRN